MMYEIVVTLQFFASLREELGIHKIQVSLPRIMTLKEFLEYVSTNVAELQGLYTKVSNTAAVKYIFLLDGKTISLFESQTVITSGSELSVLPPIGGG